MSACERRRNTAATRAEQCTPRKSSGLVSVKTWPVISRLKQANFLQLVQSEILSPRHA